MGDGARLPLELGLRAVLTDVDGFSRVLQPGRALRGYQLPLAQALADSIVQGRGLEFAAVFARQSGKDETLAQLLAWLLLRQQVQGGSVVVALPSYRPQGLISRDRLAARLDTPLTRRALQVRDNVVRLGRAEVRFLSAAPGANSRGNTASLLLVANEAQDIEPDVWDAVFAPMAAASNATTLMLGTVWSSDTLLARQLRLLRAQERTDPLGRQRVFQVAWQRVAQELPAYGDYVRRQMALLGERHPFIRTEYELEELDGGGFLFPAERRELLASPPAGATADASPLIAFTLDVAGEEEADATQQRQPNRRRDATALAIWQITLAPVLADEGARADAAQEVEAVQASGGARDGGLRAHYRLLGWRAWTGVRHALLHAQLVALARQYRPQRIVVDATGVGTGLASFLGATLGARVVQPFIFSSVSKSRLGWDLLGLIDTGRVHVPLATSRSAEDEQASTTPGQTTLDALFWKQMAACRYTVLPGPGRLLRWGVEDALLHDDLVCAFALVAALDEHDWRSRTATGRGGDATPSVR